MDSRSDLSAETKAALKESQSLGEETQVLPKLRQRERIKTNDEIETERRRSAWILALGFTVILILFEGLSVALRTRAALCCGTLVLTTYELTFGALLSYLISQFTRARPKQRGTGVTLGSGLALAIWTTGSIYFVKERASMPTRIDGIAILEVLDATFHDIFAAIKFALGASGSVPPIAVPMNKNLIQFEFLRPVARISTIWAAFEPLGTAAFMADESSTLFSSLAGVFTSFFVFFTLGDNTSLIFADGSTTPTTYLKFFEVFLLCIALVMGSFASIWTRAAGPDDRLSILSLTAAALTAPYAIIVHGLTDFYLNSASSFALVFLASCASQCTCEARVRCYAFLPSTAAAIVIGFFRAFALLLCLGILTSSPSFPPSSMHNYI